MNNDHYSLKLADYTKYIKVNCLKSNSNQVKSYNPLNFTQIQFGQAFMKNLTGLFTAQTQIFDKN